MEDRKALNITMFIVGAVICGVVTFGLSFVLEMYALIVGVAVTILFFIAYYATEILKKLDKIKMGMKELKEAEKAEEIENEQKNV